MRPIVGSEVDRDSFLEVGQNFGGWISARPDGLPLLLANAPDHCGGAWSADTCQSVMRFVDLAEAFHLPWST